MVDEVVRVWVAVSCRQYPISRSSGSRKKIVKFCSQIVWAAMIAWCKISQVKQSFGPTFMLKSCWICSVHWRIASGFFFGWPKPSRTIMSVQFWIDNAILRRLGLSWVDSVYFLCVCVWRRCQLILLFNRFLEQGKDGFVLCSFARKMLLVKHVWWLKIIAI